MEATITVWGDFALFTRPESKVERLTYPVPTPSAARGILASIYSKPAEFYWQIRRIEVLRPIRYTSFKRNEVKGKASVSKSAPEKACIQVEEDRTQRQSVVLKDVRYRITASIIPRREFRGTVTQLYNQFERRVQRGQMFVQPVMGTREFPAYFEWGTNPEDTPIPESMDLGLMVYDVYDLYDPSVFGPKSKPSVTLFHARMEQGVIQIPPYDSALVLKPGKEDAGC